MNSFSTLSSPTRPVDDERRLLHPVFHVEWSPEVPSLMYTPHPPDNRLHAFVTNSLVEAAKNNVSLRFSEFRAMRQTVEQLARAIDNARPDLIPFFATGGIPFMIPAMHCLYDRKVYDLVDGSHFHMFPGLSWNGKLNGVDSETFFATEFGSLVESHAHKTGSVRIWTMDATFTGNAIRKLLNALQRCMAELKTRPKSISVSILAVIDASRAEKSPGDDRLQLSTSHENLYLKRPRDFSPAVDLVDRQPRSFVRNDGNDLFDLTIEYWTLPAIPTEDRAELIGAVAKKDALGIESDHQIGRLTVEFDNGYSPSGTGGGSLGNKVLNWLSKTEDQLPWSKWIELDQAEPVSEAERADYEEGKRQTTGGLRIFELMYEPPSQVVSGLLTQSGLLDDAEVYCLKELAFREFSEGGGVQPTSFPDKLLRKVLASARANEDAIDDALQLFRVCRLEIAAAEQQDRDPHDLLDWWDGRLSRDAI